MEQHLQEGGEPTKLSFINHVFSTNDESKAEVFNAVQYGLIGVVPIVLLNKFIQKFIPDADPEKSALELVIEVLIQLIIMLGGIILVHRMITYIPSYSGFKYDTLNITNVILAFLVIVLSLQTKIGLKVNMLAEKVMELYNGKPVEENMDNMKAKNRGATKHNASQADHLDDPNMQQGSFPPAPVATVNKPQMDTFGNSAMQNALAQESFGPMAANAVVGGSFGAF
jgi:hypothetical protein|uniref:Uncharacterized protein n=1 Tax=viral metagenome TaxID=1070528 RepID=A0A6C0IPN1_9ZZZZ